MKRNSSFQQVNSKQLLSMMLIGLSLLMSGCSGTDARKHEFLERGQTYYNHKNYDKARVELRNALQIDPKFVEARYLAGQVAEKRNDIRDAAGQYQAAVDANPRYQPARAALARLYMLSGLSDKARELIEEGLKADQSNAALLTVRGALEAQAGKVIPALEDAEAANKLVPNDEYTISLLASLYRQSERTDKAIEVIEAGIQHLPESIDLRVVLADLKGRQQDYAGVEDQLKEIIKLDPVTIINRSRLVQFYMFRKDSAAAEATWRQAIVDMPERVEPKLALIDLLWSQRSEDVAMTEMQSIAGREPENAELQLAFGSYLLRQNKLERAEQIYHDVIKKENLQAKGLQARDQLAALYLKRSDNKLNDESHAQTLIAEVLKESPRDNDALILRANVALQHGEASTAITDLRSVLRDQPNATPLMRALARAHLQNNEIALAEETLRSAVQSNPGDVDARKQLAQILLQQNKAEQARPILEQLVASQGATPDIDVLDGVFKTQMVAKDYAAAKQTVDRVQQLHPEMAMGWYYAALVAEAQQDRDSARKNYQHALDIQSDVVEPLVALVRMDMYDKQNKRAMDRLNQVIAKQPGNAVAHNLRGELLVADKQWSAANDAFKQVTTLAPQWSVGYRNLAMAQLQQKQAEAAIVTYQTGIAKTSNASLVVELALLHEQLGKPDEAIKTYENLLAQQPKSIPIANNLVMLLLNYHGNDKASLDRASKLTEMLATSSDPALLDTRGWFKYKNGDYQAAVNLLQQAVDTQTVSATIRYHLGMAQLRAGNSTSARSNLQSALAAGKNFFGADEAQAELNKLSQAG